jgi:hypothetical protein
MLTERALGADLAVLQDISRIIYKWNQHAT